jgi:hypothetical protein
MEIKASEVEVGMTIRKSVNEVIKVKKICINPYFDWIGFTYGEETNYYNFFGWFKPEQPILWVD